MKILPVVQGSEEWLRARAGIPTASEFCNLVTPLWKVKTGDGVETYLCKKLAERWRGTPLPGWGGGAMEQGSMLEEEALNDYALRTGRQTVGVTYVKVGGVTQHQGFVTTDDGKIGCSPDGMFADGTGIESKCPELHTQVRYLLDGELPDAYKAQVQGAMLVTGAPSWVFLSYTRELPPLTLTVKRDEKAIEALADALRAFNERLDAAFARLVEINGGPPLSADDAGDNDLYGII